METLRQVVIGVSGLDEPKGKIFVVAFDTVDEVHEYVPAQFIAHAWSGHNVMRQPVIVLAGESLERDRQIVTHELTHVIMYSVIATQPTWFAEGIAGYFETVRLNEQHANLEIGVPLRGRIATLHREGPRPVAQLFGCDHPKCEDDVFYATTWALFAYLQNEHPHELSRYMSQLAATPLGQHPPTWTEVVPSLPPATLDQELRTWLAYGNLRVLRYNIELREWPSTERPLAEADVLAAKGVLRYLGRRDHLELPEIDQALALDRMNVLANLVTAVDEGRVDPDRAHALTAAHPDDWRAWWLAWRAARTFAESSEARDKTCSLAAASSVAVAIDECSRPAP